jgi:hypothetical protein
LFYRFSKHDQIGEVKIPLNQIDLAQTIEEWRDLTSVEGEQGQVSNYFYAPSILIIICCRLLKHYSNYLKLFFIFSNKTNQNIH